MSDPSDDLGSLLSEFDEVAMPRRGDLLRGIVISAGSHGLVVDLALKRDGVVPASDLDKLPPEEAGLNVGDEIAVMVVDPVDPEGSLVVSVSQARESEDWLKARSLMEDDAIIEVAPCACNRGGIIVPFGRLRGFVPASHLSDLPRGIDEEDRLAFLEGSIGRKMPFKVIEVDPKRRRLVLSERKAIRQWRQQQKAKIIDTLQMGDVRKGVVTSLREFGAFVDIGGADGLIHISEIDWCRIEDPGEVLSIGQEIEIMVIGLDKRAVRIGLSLKRLKPNPWEECSKNIDAGQILQGVVSCNSSAGTFVQVDGGIEGLLRLTKEDQIPHKGETIRVKVASLDIERERLDLELVIGDVEAAIEEGNPDEIGLEAEMDGR
ncbi:MAG TPA: S1 RNA-binding domain-containing protein [Anaerolineae bacterium]|nr:S1 RNA-binding domain-containing protein [Anaerolineae bacterium]